MKIFTAEFQKIFSKKTFLLLIVALVVNWVLLGYGTQQQYQNAAPPEAYRQVFTELSGKTEAEKLAFLQEKLDRLNACSLWENQAEMEYNEENSLSEEELTLMEQYRKDYENQSYLEYTDSLYMEKNFIEKLYQQAKSVTEYDAMVDGVLKEAETKTSISIFSEPDSFSYRNLKNAAAKFETMYGTPTTFDISEGVNAATKSVATDLIVVLILLFVSGELIIREKERGLLPIIKSTKNGRLRVILSKIAVLLGLSVFCSILFFGENLIYAQVTFGLGDLTRSIQSVSGYLTSALSLSVGEYLLCFFLIKAVAYFLAAMLAMLACVILFHPAPSYLCVAVVIGVSYVLYGTILPVSRWNLFRYLNLANFLSVTPLFDSYQNLNLFEYPFEVLPASLITMAVLLLLFVFLSIWIFCVKKTSERSLRLPNFLHLRKRPKTGRSVSLFYHESFKLLMSNKALILLILFVLFQWNTVRSSVFYSPEEMYYKSYMTALGGPLTPEKEQYLADEQEKFDQAQQNLAEIQQKFAAGEIGKDELRLLTESYQKILAPQRTFSEKILPQYEYIKQMQAEGEDPNFVYETGFLSLMGQGNELVNAQSDIQNGTILLLLMILCFSGLFSMEYSTGAQNIVSVYLHGRRRTVLRKVAVSALLLAAFFVLTYLPDFLYVFKNYGLPLANAPLNSIQLFAGWGAGWQIWHYFVLLYALRFLVAFCLLLIIQWLSCKLKNFTTALFGSVGFLLSPFLLHLLGVQWLDYFGFLLPLSGNSLLIGSAPTVAVLYYFAAVLLGGLCGFLLLRFPTCRLRGR